MSHWDRWLKSFVKKKCKGILTISIFNDFERRRQTAKKRIVCQKPFSCLGDNRVFLLAKVVSTYFTDYLFHGMCDRIGKGGSVFVLIAIFVDDGRIHMPIPMHPVRKKYLQRCLRFLSHMQSHFSRSNESIFPEMSCFSASYSHNASLSICQDLGVEKGSSVFGGSENK